MAKINPIYTSWRRHQDAIIRYEFLEILYRRYDGMLEDALREFKKGRKGSLCHEKNSIVNGVSRLVRWGINLFCK